MKVAVFIGTRPEAIKMAPVIRALEAAEDFEPIVISTGQHKEMLQQVVDLFQITVHHSLSVMQPNQTLAGLTSRLVLAIDEKLAEIQPDFSLVQGDTTTVLCGALCSFYRGIPVGHVEAGLRTGNLKAPFPEEANRVLAGRLMTLHFPPTTLSRQNLLEEKVPEKSITVTGNTVIDALHMELERQERTKDGEKILAELSQLIGRGFPEKRFVLITGHRRENFGGGFDEICTALGDLARRFPDHQFVYPVHLNPNVQRPVFERLGGLDNVILIEPQPYSSFVALMNKSHVILTDSGGVQEEAPSLGKPVLVMRDTTERPEGLEAGTVKLVGAHAHKIIAEVSELLSDEGAYLKMSEATNPYGDGKAAARIVAALREYRASAASA